MWRLDRLGRTARELVPFLDELDGQGVRLVSIRDGGALDSSTPAGRMFRTLLVAFSEYEREIISERTRAGIAKAKAEGKTWGGRKKGARFVLTPKKVETIKTLAEAGTSKTEIARQLGISRRSVYRAIDLLGLGGGT